MELMIFRIVFNGKINNLKEAQAAAQEVNPTAFTTWLGIVEPDDAIEAKVKDVDEGKALMKHIYQKTGRSPRYYTYVDGESFWTNNFKTFLGTTVYSDEYDYEEPVTEEHFEDFLKD